MRKTIQDEEAKKPINGFQIIIISFFVAIINIKNEVRQTGRPNHFAGLSKKPSCLIYQKPGLTRF